MRDSIALARNNTLTHSHHPRNNTHARSLPLPRTTITASGAYVFRPTTDTALIPVAAAASTELITGAVASEARLVYAPWLSIVLRLWANASDVEVEWTVGPIPFSDGLGREVVIRYGTGLATAGMWYSDSNGRDSMRRMRNARPSWPLVLTEPVADNYVPVTAFQWLSDNTTTLSVVTDRAQVSAGVCAILLCFRARVRCY